jgi:hypothetical protein
VFDPLTLVAALAASAVQPARDLISQRVKWAMDAVSKAQRRQRVWTIIHYALGLLAAIASAAAGVTVVASLRPWIPATLAFTAAVVGAAVTFLKPEAQMQEQKQEAEKWEDEKLYLETALAIDLSDDDLDRDELMRRLQPLLDRHHQRLTREDSTSRQLNGPVSSADESGQRTGTDN